MKSFLVSLSSTWWVTKKWGPEWGTQWKVAWPLPSWSVQYGKILREQIYSPPGWTGWLVTKNLSCPFSQRVHLDISHITYISWWLDVPVTPSTYGPFWGLLTGFWVYSPAQLLFHPDPGPAHPRQSRSGSQPGLLSLGHDQGSNLGIVDSPPWPGPESKIGVPPPPPPWQGRGVQFGSWMPAPGPGGGSGWRPWTLIKPGPQLNSGSRSSICRPASWMLGDPVGDEGIRTGIGLARNCKWDRDWDWPVTGSDEAKEMRRVQSGQGGWDDRWWGE